MGETPLVRLPDWEPRLVAYLEAIAQRPFVYGQSDCFAFTKGAVLAMTGVDLFAEFDGAWGSRFGAMRVMRRRGYRGTLGAAHGLLDDLGLACVPEAQAQFGDIAAAPGDPEASIGIAGREGLILQGPDGLVLIPPGHALCLWRLPHA